MQDLHCGYYAKMCQECNSTCRTLSTCEDPREHLNRSYVEENQSLALTCTFGDSKLLEYGIKNFLCGTLAAKIRGQNLTLADNLIDCLINPVRARVVAHKA